MNEYKNETYETFDITPVMVLLFFIVAGIICIVKKVDMSRIRFEFKQFERQTLKGWIDMMKLSYPYDYSSKINPCTDVCERKIRTINNKK